MKQSVRLPGSVFLVGMPDPYNVLPEGTVFVALRDRSDDQRAKKRYRGKIIEGSVVVTRHPMHSVSNIRALRAVNDDKLRQHMKNLQGGVIFFSTLGPKSDVHYMGGGDFDGDMYLVIYENLRIIEAVRRSEPCTINESADFIDESKKSIKIANDPKRESSGQTENVGKEIFFDLLKTAKSSLVGKLSNCWLAKADQHGPRHKDCELLSVFINTALDSSKTGEHLNIESSNTAVGQYLEYNRRPHYTQPKRGTNFEIYKSTSIVGKLFDLVSNASIAISEDEDRYNISGIEPDEDYGWIGYSTDEGERMAFKAAVE